MYFDAVGSAEGLLAFSQDGPRTHPLILSRLHCQPNHPHIYHHDLSVKAGHPPRRTYKKGPSKRTFPKGSHCQGNPPSPRDIPQEKPCPISGNSLQDLTEN